MRHKLPHFTIKLSTYTPSEVGWQNIKRLFNISAVPVAKHMLGVSVPWTLFSSFQVFRLLFLILSINLHLL